MKSPLPNFAIAAVRVWTRLYTWRMEPAVREARCAEIESDLWEFQRDTEGGSQSFTLQVLVRLILGIPDDVGWRIDQVASSERVSRRTVALTATAAGGVLFASALSVIASDATRKAPPSTFLIATRGLVDAEIARIMRADTAASWKTLQAGILAVAVPVTGNTRGDVPLYSQTSSAVVTPAFEVASIEVNRSGDLRTTMAYRPGGQFIATNVTLGRLIRDAFQRSTFEISGAPSWMESNRFDIAAKAQGDALPAEMRLMLRALLVERYQLKVHQETRQGPIYELVLAKSNGRFGPQLRRADADCDRAPATPPPPYPDGLPSCGFIGPTMQAGAQTLAFRGLTMDGLAKFLAPAVRRFVVDRTGLTGYFDGELDRTAELQPPPPPPGAPDPFDRQSFPSMFTALPDRLGLKLRPSRGPIDVLVIDSVQQPTPD
jgi:uncharacterized protein (TIGR03435 family)